MRLLGFKRTDLFEVEVESKPELDLKAVADEAQRAGARVFAVDNRRWCVIGPRTDLATWKVALQEAGAEVVYEGNPSDGAYGPVDIVGAHQGGKGEVYWIERVSAQTGDLSDGPIDEPIYHVSHVNPLGETEMEQVRAPNALASVEKYAAYVMDCYGEAHFPHGSLAMQVVGIDDSPMSFEAARDLTIVLSTPR